ncbi:MAG: hypothetical protein HOQ32_07900 [Lysobacter sp.]|nr:hypothetical protein [Lysobacter sp.]
MSHQSSIEEAFDRHKHAAYGRHLRVCRLFESAAAGEPIENLAHDHITLEMEAEQAALHLSALVSNLPESKLVELVRCSAEQYRAWRSIDPDLSELIQFKHEIYRYIVNPGPAVVAAHEYHVAETSSGKV